eukprot:TRINITY_DN11699_c0_g2_i1.p1 TRINITY_DN11699_c0_g2~~TRINITY_DN11699_c0_g2_i1.p1  ORF type:complete len:269 (-),score=61.06 TRINITY_DN11699_c0_g2_i1:205-1011(-)
MQSFLLQNQGIFLQLNRSIPIFSKFKSTFRGFASATTMEKINFGDSLPGYEIGEKTAPAVILIQEWWGITDTVKAQASDISSQGGFRCLVPDLYKGKIGVDKEEASHLMGALDFQAAVQEIKQGVEYLKSSGSPKVGAVGTCMGGALCFASAQHAGVDAAAAFYGIPQAAICTPEEIKVPFQASFGMLDTMKGFSDADTGKQVEQRMKDAGCECEFFYYEGAGHAFLNATYGEDALAKMNSMNFPIPPKEVTDTAWKRLMDFLAKNLK